MPTTGPFFPHGFEERFFAALETTYDTDTKPAAADAISVLESDFTPDQSIITSEEKTGNRLPPDFYKGHRSAKGSCSFYAKPQAAGTAPDYDAILEAALGTKTVVGGTSVTYAHTDTAIAKTLRLHRGAGNGLMESLYGAIVDQLNFEIVGSQVPKISANFAGARLARAKAAVLTVAGGIGTGTFTVAAGEGKRFEKGSTIRGLKAGGVTEDNGGLGYLVTSDSTDVVTFAPVLVSALAIGDEAMAFTPTPVVAGTVAAAVDQEVTIAGAAINFMNAKVTYKTGLRLRENEAQTSRPSGSFSGKSTVEGEIEAYLREDQLGNISYSEWDKTYKALVIRAGANVAGQRMKLNIANALLNVAAVKIPGGDGTAALLNIKFMGKAAFTVVHD